MHPSPSEEIAHTTARLVVQQGLEWGPAKRRALRQLGLPARTPLPDNDQVEAALRTHLRLFCGATQPGELRALRRLALVWMTRMAAFRPHLCGAVWNGTATQLSDVYLELFCDDPKSAEIALINRHQAYEPGRMVGPQGRPVEALSLVCRVCEFAAPTGVHLLIHDLDALRGALRADARGRIARGDITAVRRLLETEAPAP